MREVIIGASEQLGLGIAEHAAERGIGGNDTPRIGGRNGQRHRAVVEHLLEAPLAVTQRVRPVAHRRDELGVGGMQGAGLALAQHGGESAEQQRQRQSATTAQQQRLARAVRRRLALRKQVSLGMVECSEIGPDFRHQVRAVTLTHPDGERLHIAAARDRDRP
jgi:hypothetical protein